MTYLADSMRENWLNPIDDLENPHEEEARDNLEQLFAEDVEYYVWESLIDSKTPALNALFNAVAVEKPLTVDLQMSVIKELIDVVQKTKDDFINARLSAEMKRLDDYWRGI